jgi:GTPase SAR1 family protein
MEEVKHHCPNGAIVLVATKKDLRKDATVIEHLKKNNLAPITFEQVILYLPLSLKKMKGNSIGSEDQRSWYEIS